ncbi:MAG: fatty acid desaturase [Roseiarcus sp.]
MSQPLPALAELHKIRPAIYWMDFLASAAVGWTAFAAAVAYPLGAPVGVVAIVVAIVALNRAVAFTHEISHQSRRLPGFEAVWNALVGFPLLVPTFIYGRVHLDHHRVAIYGTAGDPSYLPFARSAWLAGAYMLQTLIAPVFLIVRFFLLAPVGLASRRFENWLLAHVSAITFNPAYRRTPGADLVRAARRDTVFLLALWAALVALALLAPNPAIPARAAALWYLVLTAINVLEGLRSLAEHAYDSSGAPLDKAGQIADSHDMPGGLFTEFWAPVGLRFHATHHAYPGIPYYALPRAYRRLVAESPEHEKRTRAGLVPTLRELFGKGARRG